MADGPTNLPPAGWYTDPSDAGQQRWWGGVSWTDHVQEIPFTPQPLLPASPGVPEDRAEDAPAQTDIEEPAQLPAQVAAQAQATVESPVQALVASSAKSAVQSSVQSPVQSPVVQATAPPIEPAPARSSVQRIDAHRIVYTPDEGPAKTNTPALVSLVLGIVSILVNPLLLVGIAALILGIIGLRRASSSFPPVGRQRALAGIILSIIGTVIGVILTIVLVTAITTFQSRLQASLSSQFNQEQVQTDLKADIEQQTGTTLESVKCPASPTIAEGASFECVARTADGANVPVEVQVHQGGYVWQVAG
jgi:hypothetical protein